jgi:S-adenosylmethionine hydrolase
LPRDAIPRRAAAIAVASLALVAAACAGRPARAPTGARPLVVFFSDFGTADDAVAICKGVMLGIARDLDVVDVTHEVPPFSVRDGARLLVGPAQYFPAGTVFLAVVDPGVGGGRRAIVARSRRGQYFVLPDNGLVTLIADRDGLEEVREIVNPAWMRAGAVSSTFHGRDVFAPVAARIARGDDWREVGPVIDAPVRIQVAGVSRDADGLVGEVVALDGHFGNLLTNVEAADFAALGWTAGDRVGVRLGTRQLTLPFVRTFAEVPEGTPLLYVDSREHIALAINRGHFAEKYRVSVPSRIVIRRKPDTRGEQR